MNSIDWKDWYKKRDKETVCEVFKVKNKQLRKILDLLENSFPAFLLDQQPNTWSEFFKSRPFFSSLLGSLTYSSRFLQPQTQPPSPSAEKSSSADPSYQVNATRSCSPHLCILEGYALFSLKLEPYFLPHNLKQTLKSFSNIYF